MSSPGRHSDPIRDGGRPFATTHWSIVLAAGASMVAAAGQIQGGQPTPTTRTAFEGRPSSRPGEAATRPGADIPGLPRVLIIGDSISIGYTRPVQELLKGKANVQRIPGNAEHTGTGLAKLDAWLGDGKWDIIHFNWGLWDLCYRSQDPDKRMQKDKVNGKLTHTPEEYEKNLAELVRRLKATGAKLIWASTTPVPEGEPGRVVGDDVKYNAVAKKIMDANGIPIDDLYAHVQPRFAELGVRPGDVHYKPEGYRFLAEKVAASVLEALRPDPAPASQATTRAATPRGAGPQGQTAGAAVRD